MKKLFALIISLFFAGCSPAQVHQSPNEFPSEQEVTAFLKVGLSKGDVVKKLGQPTIKTSQPTGSSVDEIDYYFKPPSKILTAQHFAYDGFQISFVKDRVSDFSIIHKSVLVPPP